MKIKRERPPVYDLIVSAGMRPHEGVVYTYGDTIYNPSGNELPDHIVHHEETHCLQQGDDPDAWWERYVTDPYFRFEQEAEAYAAQYDFMCESIRDRNRRSKILFDMALMLSGPVYGGTVSHSVARKMIKNKAKTKP